jgi:methylenetetrahydrofolate dehydrogenase (NADP+) / methenyltetrahydrofolate cyclohydrolase
MYKLIDGKKVAESIRNKIKDEINSLDTKPGLAVVLIGNDPSSKVYVNLKYKKCMEVGIESYKYELSEDSSEDDVIELITKLNDDKKINGILVQMPLPKHINRNNVLKAVDVSKDVDGFNPESIGNLILNKQGLYPCTPVGIIKLIDHYNIDVKGKEVVVIGNSIIVGNPISQLLLNRMATVTVCHIETKDLSLYTKKADIIISAVGKKNLVTKDMVKEGVIIFDVGINKDKEDGKIYGDVDFEQVKDLCSYITPVPGGIGPMTIACLLENTLIAYKNQGKDK